MSEKRSVLIVDKMHENILSLLPNIGFEVNYQPELKREGILKQIHEYDGLVIRSKTTVDKELIDAGVRLKFVARAGAGLDQLDHSYLVSKGIQIINAPEGNRDAVGEHALGLLLSVSNKIARANTEVKNFKWDRESNRGFEIKGKTVGVFGFGNTGQSFARKLTGFDCSILAYDKYKAEFGNDIIEEVDLSDFKSRVEILSVHVPLTEETKHLFDSSELAEYKNLKVLINTSRGEVLVTDSLIDLLDAGKLMGAGLDVLENEKLASLNESEIKSFSKLSSFENVVLTPHVAGWTYESYERIGEVIADKIAKLDLD